MNLAVKKKKEHFTYRDYCGWPENERWELIDGEAYNMTPAPSPRHQEILTNILTGFSNYLNGKSCKVYPAPFDVRLPAGTESDDDIETVVQPDISVGCDKKKIDDKGCRGAPDLVVEILSPATAGKDMKIKQALYEQEKVKEYWIVHPSDRTVMVYTLGKNGKYGKPAVYTAEDSVKVSIFKDLKIQLADVFAD